MVLRGLGTIGGEHGVKTAMVSPTLVYSLKNDQIYEEWTAKLAYGEGQWHPSHPVENRHRMTGIY